MLAATRFGKKIFPPHKADEIRAGMYKREKVAHAERHKCHGNVRWIV